MRYQFTVLSCLAFLAVAAFAEEKTVTVTVATILESQLEGFDGYTEPVKDLVRDALGLTRLGLGYHYGCSDPAKGGMDCSGTMNHLISLQGVKKVPRQSDEFYRWVWRESRFNAVTSDKPTSFEMDLLQPGDLLFWTGTYKAEREHPITHVMMYLGKLKEDGRPVMMGASNGRSYGGVARHGVSVFDFRFPSQGKVTSSGTTPRFIGYGPIPGLITAYEKRHLAKED